MSRPITVPPIRLTDERYFELRSRWAQGLQNRTTYEESALYKLVRQYSGWAARNELEREWKDAAGNLIGSMIQKGAAFGSFSTTWHRAAVDTANELTRAGYWDRAKEIVLASGMAVPHDWEYLCAQLESMGPLPGGLLHRDASMAPMEHIQAVAREMAAKRGMGTWTHGLILPPRPIPEEVPA